MNTEHSQVGWGFWLRWMYANTVGVIVGIFAGGLAGVVVMFAMASGLEYAPRIAQESALGFAVYAVLGTTVGI